MSNDYTLPLYAFLGYFSLCLSRALSIDVPHSLHLLLLVSLPPKALKMPSTIRNPFGYIQVNFVY